MSPAAWLRDFAQRYEAGTLKDVRADVSVLQKIADALDADEAMEALKKARIPATPKGGA